MAQVFVSYSWQDQPLARRVARRLRHAGLEVFLDRDRARDLAVGTDLPTALAGAIDRASHVLLLWTPAAAESVARAGYVRYELELADAARARGLVLVPLLFHDPRENSLVSSTIGVTFRAPHRFEDDWRTLLRTTFPAAHDGPDEVALAADLAETLIETPSLRGLFRGPLDGSFDTASAALMSGQERESALARARHAVAGWSTEMVSTTGLPTQASPDWHALDFSLWCAARLAARPADGSGLSPLELATLPDLLGRVLAASGAGFGAYGVLLASFPRLALSSLERIGASTVLAQDVLPVALDLLGAAFAESTPRQPLPFDTVARFVRTQEERLTIAQRTRLFGLIDAAGNVPGGTTTDLLLELMRTAELRPAVVEKMVAWVNGGLFDRPSPDRGRDSPMIAHGVVRAMTKNGHRVEAEQLMEAICARVRRLLRSGTDAERTNAIRRWIAQANRLPPALGWRFMRAVEEGVISAEFESTPYGAALGPIALQIATQATSRGEAGVSLKELDAVLHAHNLPVD